MKEKKSGEQRAQLLQKHTLTLLLIRKVDQCSGKPLGLRRRNRFYKTPPSILFSLVISVRKSQRSSPAIHVLILSEVYKKNMSDELKHVTGQQQQPNWPQVSEGDELWLCFFKPHAVLGTEAAFGAIRYSYGALDLLFTKKNPSLLKWPLLLQPSISAASNN